MNQAFKGRLSQKVRQLRGNQTQTRFASILKISQSTVAAWEKGENVPDLENIEKLAELADQKPEEFLAELYGRKIDTKECPPLAFAITTMNNQEISGVLMLIAQKIGGNQT